MKLSPLDVQELVDLCISFLSDTPEDLTTCSMVARSWMDAAQAKLFFAPHLTNVRVITTVDRVALKFYDILVTSPHLLRYVRAICLIQATLSSSTDAKLSCLEFPRLETLSLDTVYLAHWMPHLGSLPKSPSLRRLHLFLPGAFTHSAHLLEDFSPTVQHLELLCTHWDPTELTPGPGSVPSIYLTSLYLRVLDDPYETPQCLSSTATYPFNLEQLKYLAIWDARCIAWDSIAKETKRSIEVLQLGIKGSERVDLAPFSNLHDICLVLLHSKPVPRGCRDTLSTITSSHHIRSIRIWVGDSEIGEDEEYGKLDLVLSTLPLHPLPIVKFESSIEPEAREESMRKLFPKVVAQNRFKFTYYPCKIEDVGRQLLSR
ncbi:hypothetical protein R3P38DRAFT_2981774 [Favolaschia claudopus]|uniref:F-box domain-containing protein n=1 Tax=Favolaschia claudopus TaxID=2862362 RepID=A0AAW0AX86_9AGAR